MAPVSRRYARGGRNSPATSPRALAQQSLKVVVFNVLRGELQRLTGYDLSGGIDLILTRPLSFLDRKRVAGLSLNLSLGQILGCVVGHVAEFDRIPEVESLDRSIQHVLSGDTGNAIARYLDRSRFVYG